MLLASVTEPRSMTMQDQVNAVPAPKRVPYTKIESTVRYLGIEVDDALVIAEQVDV